MLSHRFGFRHFNLLLFFLMLSSGCGGSHCVLKVIAVAPEEGAENCEKLRKGDVVCIACPENSGECSAEKYDCVRRTERPPISGVCEISVTVIDSDKECQDCPEDGKTLTKPDGANFGWVCKER